MAQFSVRTGVLLARDTVGTQKVVCGFRPKAVAMVSVSEFLEAPNTAQSLISGSFGFSDGTIQRGTYHYSLTFGNVHAARRSGQSIYASIDHLANVRQKARVISFDVDGFTLNWEKVIAGTNTAIVFMAIGGDAVSAKVVEWQAPASTGVQTVDGVGFQPDFMFHLSSALTSAVTGLADNSVHMIGMQNAIGENTVQGSSSETDTVPTITTNTKHWISNSDCVLVHNPSTGAVLYAADHNSVNSDGFAVDWTTVWAGRPWMFSLCVAGLDTKLLGIRKVSSGVSNTIQNFTGFGFQPQAVLGTWTPESIAANYTTGRMIRDNWDMEMGAFDGVTQSSGYGIHDDAGAAAAYAYIDLKAAVVSGGAAAPSTRAKAIWNGWLADGFSLKWETSTAAAPMMFLAAFAQKNVAPHAPAQDSASFASTTAPFPLSWTFSDPDESDTQGSYEVEVEVNTGGLGVWTSFIDTGKVAGAASTYNITSGTMATGTEYRWRVRVWDNKDLVGPFTNFRTFRTTPAPTVAVTSPAADGAYGSDTVSLEWSFSDPEDLPQFAYQVRVVNIATSAELINTGKVLSDAQTYTATGLANGVNYRVYVKVWNQLDVPSDTPVEATRVLNVSYNPPMTPTPITFTPSTTLGRIAVSITIPATTGGFNDTKRVELYRGTSLIAKWVKSAGGFAGATVLTFNDYEARHGVAEQYNLISYSTLGTMVAVTGLSSTLNLSGIWLHKISDPVASAVLLQTVTARVWNEAPERSLLQVAGREAPLVEWGEHVDRSVDLDTALLDRNGQRALIYGYAISRETVCYRDLKGRRLKGVFAEFAGTDEIWGERAPLRIDEVVADIVVATTVTP